VAKKADIRMIGGFEKALLPLASGAAIALTLAACGEPGSGYRETVTVRTDDPRVAITSVSQFGKPVKAVGIGGPEARFVILSDEDGIPCDSDELEIRTSNNIVHYPRVNLCEAKWRILLATGQTPLPAGLSADPALKWEAFRMRDAEAPTMFLSYSIPQTDATLVLAQCEIGSGRIVTKFSGSKEGLGNAISTRIDFYTPAGLLRYDAVVSSPEENGEEYMPFALDQNANEVFWSVLKSGVQIAYRIHTSDFLVLDTHAGQAAIAKFHQTCVAR
jgi:hypothetical protein